MEILQTNQVGDTNDIDHLSNLMEMAKINSNHRAFENMTNAVRTQQKMQ